jgi:hypothetical protein
MCQELCWHPVAEARYSRWYTLTWRRVRSLFAVRLTAYHAAKELSSPSCARH